MRELYPPRRAMHAAKSKAKTHAAAQGRMTLALPNCLTYLSTSGAAPDVRLSSVRAVSLAASSGSPLLPSAVFPHDFETSAASAQRLLVRYLFGTSPAATSASTQRRDSVRREASIQLRNSGVPIEYFAQKR